MIISRTFSGVSCVYGLSLISMDNRNDSEGTSENVAIFYPLKVSSALSVDGLPVLNPRRKISNSIEIRARFEPRPYHLSFLTERRRVK